MTPVRSRVKKPKKKQKKKKTKQSFPSPNKKILVFESWFSKRTLFILFYFWLCHLLISLVSIFLSLLQLVSFFKFYFMCFFLPSTFVLSSSSHFYDFLVLSLFLLLFTFFVLSSFTISSLLPSSFFFITFQLLYLIDISLSSQLKEYPCDFIRNFEVYFKMPFF